MNKVIIIVGTIVLSACASQKNATTASTNQSTTSTLVTPPGNTRTKAVESIDESTYKLLVQSYDKTYGYSEKNPIKVGKEGGGPANERRFLNALLGPNGEPLTYERNGSCCAFKTPNGMIDNMGMLDRYTVTWEGNKTPVTLYLNMYDEGDLSIPVGFTAKQAISPRMVTDASNILFLLDNKQISKSEMERIDPAQIESIDVIKNKEDIKKYTTKEYEGVIVINLKKKP